MKKVISTLLVFALLICNLSVVYAKTDYEESFAKEAIEWAVENRFMQTETVDGKEYFLPQSEATKGEIAKALVTYLDINVKEYENVELGFADEAQTDGDVLPYIRARGSFAVVLFFGFDLRLYRRAYARKYSSYYTQPRGYSYFLCSYALARYGKGAPKGACRCERKGSKKVQARFQDLYGDHQQNAALGR